MTIPEKVSTPFARLDEMGKIIDNLLQQSVQVRNTISGQGTTVEDR